MSSLLHIVDSGFLMQSIELAKYTVGSERNYFWSRVNIIAKAIIIFKVTG